MHRRQLCWAGVKREKSAKQLSLSYQANAAAEIKRPRPSFSSLNFLSSTLPSSTRTSYAGCSLSLQRRAAWYYKHWYKICPVANNSWNSLLLQEAISFVCNFQTQHKLFVGAVLFYYGENIELTEPHSARLSFLVWCSQICYKHSDSTDGTRQRLLLSIFHFL